VPTLASNKHNGHTTPEAPAASIATTAALRKPEYVLLPVLLRVLYAPSPQRLRSVPYTKGSPHLSATRLWLQQAFWSGAPLRLQ